MKHALVRWWAVAAMMAVTFVFGTDLFSSENTRPVIRWFMQLLFGEQAGQQITGGGEGVLRKTAHFLEYGLLAILWLRAWQNGRSGWQWTWFAGAWFATTLWAAVDELQQGLISQHRTGSVWDVLLDGSGACCGLLLYYACYRFNKRDVR